MLKFLTISKVSPKGRNLTTCYIMYLLKSTITLKVRSSSLTVIAETNFDSSQIILEY